MEYDIYGNIRSQTKGEQHFIPFRNQGQYEDVELDGLMYNRFRYYDGNSGTYISQDPIGLAGNNPNIYAYVSDSNVWVDPFGLDCTKGKVGKVTYENFERKPGVFSRLVKNFKDFQYIGRYNISKYKAKFRTSKFYEKEDLTYISHYFDGVDTKGNKVTIEIANQGHPASRGGIEPAHVKVQIKGDSGVVHNSKYFLEADKYRIIEK
ncbi:RHS repeat-associated core domain-containing protein [Rapidithrix thailandica]|uniref:RHS repeat-associated core domain-containing protein n=1 Tax=Rapidithrix thailandica TaxID=413964 RepID=A0AAW9S3A5_9BACT